MKTFKISIAKPCVENWDEMTLTEQGKHCAACNKTVIDFTGMSQQEMMHILLQQRGKKICGNFYQTQIEKPVRYIGRKQLNKWPPIAAMLVAGMFQLIPANAYAQTEKTHETKTLQVYNKSYHTEKREVKTEPSKDSLQLFSIKVLSRQDKSLITGASVSLLNIGTYTTDKKGEISFSIESSKIPNTIQVSVTAYGFEYTDFTIQKSKLSKGRLYELWLNKQEMIMMKGDVSIEDLH